MQEHDLHILPLSQSSAEPSIRCLHLNQALLRGATHHSSIDHWRVLSEDSAPAVALDIYEAEQLGVFDVFPRHIPSVGRQVGGKGEACDRVLGKFCSTHDCVRTCGVSETCLSMAGVEGAGSCLKAAINQALPDAWQGLRVPEPD